MQKLEVRKIIGYTLMGVFLILFSYYCISLYIPQYYLIYTIGFSLSIVLFLVSVFNLEYSFLLFILLIPIVGPINYVLKSTDFHFHYFLFLGFFLGGLINIIRHKKSLIYFDLRIYKPAIIFIILLFISIIFTIIRLKVLPLVEYNIQDFNTNILAVGNLQAVKYATNLFLFYLSGFFLFFVTATLEINKKFLRRLFYFLSGGFLITFFYGLYQIIVNPYFYNDASYAKYNQINSTLIGPNGYGMYLGILFPVFIGFGYYLYNHKKILGFYSFILSFLTLIMIFYSGARASFLGILIVIFFYIFYFGLILIRKIFRRFNLKKLLLNLISYLIIIIIISSFIFGSFFFIKNIDTNKNYPSIFIRLKNDIDSFEETDYEKIMNSRQRNWAQAINMVIDYPISGVGIGQYVIELPKYNVREYGNTISNQIEDPLSFYFQIVSEMGIFQLMLILWFFAEVIIFSVIFYRKIKNKRFKFLYLNLLVSFIGMLVVYGLSGNINLFPPMFMFFALIGILVNFSINYKKKDYESIYLNEK